MRAAQSFNEILALRGRIALFTPSAAVALPFEQAAARVFAQIVSTRGVPDKYGPLSAWTRLHASREFALFSLDQSTWVHGVRFPATDLVWVGEMGHPKNAPHIWIRFSNAMHRVPPELEPRQWAIAENAASTPKAGDPA